MSNELDYIMGGVKAVITDEENTWYDRGDVLSAGWWKALKHLLSTGRWDRMKNIYNLYSKHKENDSEAVTNLIMEIAEGMYVKEVDQFGRNLSLRPRQYVVDFLKSYPASRCLLTRDPYIVSYHTILTAEENSIPFHHYITNDAEIMEGKITRELKLKLSNGMREKISEEREIPYDGMKTAHHKHVLFDALVEDVLGMDYEEVLYLHDDGDTEQDILRDHQDSCILAKELERLMQPFYPKTLA